jgi:hypothetical protein
MTATHILNARKRTATERMHAVCAELAAAYGIEAAWSEVLEASKVNLAKGINAEHAAVFGLEATASFLEQLANRLQEEEGNVAYTAVLAGAGATLPVRDSVDQRIIDDVVNRVDRAFWNGETKAAPTISWPNL